MITEINRKSFCHGFFPLYLASVKVTVNHTQVVMSMRFSMGERNVDLVSGNRRIQADTNSDFINTVPEFLT